MSKCLCCKNEGVFSILLAEGIYADRDDPRWYIPNQSVRELTDADNVSDIVKELWFCHPCMRMIEDNLRATIMYLQSEDGLKFQRAA